MCMKRRLSIFFDDCVYFICSKCRKIWWSIWIWRKHSGCIFREANHQIPATMVLKRNKSFCNRALGFNIVHIKPALGFDIK
ncbi:hypothetical protein B9Z38_14755 [Limnohabitans sp. MMS-10A-160]|nr:hypothetical protein B9Z38_14755 [Limnohabitans sp. MMS-10A-160]